MAGKVNAAVCPDCGDLIRSVRRHDWVCCSCWVSCSGQPPKGIFVDGGDDYYRRGYSGKEPFNVPDQEAYDALAKLTKEERLEYMTELSEAEEDS